MPMQELSWAKKNGLNTLSDSELIKRYRLDGAGIVFVTDLVRRGLVSPTVVG